MFIFSDNSKFTHIKAMSDDPNCLVGSAIGTYSWNPTTTELNIKLGADSTASEEAGSCSIGGNSKLAVNNNAIVLDNNEGMFYTFTKSTTAAGLVGTWINGNIDDFAVIVFTGTHYFISDYIKQQGYGTEHGSYIYNLGLGQLTATVFGDNNGDAGFSNAEGEPLPLVIANDNNSFTVGDGFVLKRLK